MIHAKGYPAPRRPRVGDIDPDGSPHALFFVLCTICAIKRATHITTITLLNSAGARSQHRCTPGSAGGPESVPTRESRMILYIDLHVVIGDGPRSLVSV